MDTKQVSIASFNDDFRRRGLGVTVTHGVMCLPDLSGLLQEVREFEIFEEGNDPYGEHDFGTIRWGPEKVFWKIDYYDSNLRYWEDPLSPTCHRVLTVMLASEY
jgi:hypothetical protein